MRSFKDADDDYIAWLASHSDGFVLNTHRKPRPAYLRLHRATCRLIRGTPTNGQHWTRDYIKYCGTRAELETWAEHTVGGSVWTCPRCM